MLATLDAANTTALHAANTTVPQSLDATGQLLAQSPSFGKRAPRAKLKQASTKRCKVTVKAQRLASAHHVPT